MIRDQPIQSHGNRTTVLSVHHSGRNAIRFEKAPNGNRTSRIPRRARRRLNSPSVQMLVIELLVTSSLKAVEHLERDHFRSKNICGCANSKDTHLLGCLARAITTASRGSCALHTVATKQGLCTLGSAVIEKSSSRSRAAERLSVTE